MKKKKILITGGLGFIGTHCIEKWSSLGYNITIIDNLSSNALPPTHELFKDCKIIIKNILDVDITQLEKFDKVLHESEITNNIFLSRNIITYHI